MDSKFKMYQKMTITEIRPYQKGEQLPESVGISSLLLMNGSPKAGDMVCRDRRNHDDVWLIDQEYFKKNYVSVGASAIQTEIEKSGISKGNLLLIKSVLSNYKLRMYHKQEFDPKKSFVLDEKILESLESIILNELEIMYKDS